uniref:Envelope fusion protein n=1 Tax=Trichogramma kaykai TaxID=54128 RepID=A0ABD2VTX5_9HYME
MAYDNLLSSKLRSKKYYDQHTNEKNFKPGDYVFLLSGSTNKRKDQYSGPFKILEILNNHNVRLQIKKKSKIMNLLSLKLFCLVSTAYCALYLTEKIDHSPGIYFEKEENIRYYNAQWDIVVFIDTDPLYHLMPHVHSALEQANATCKDPEMCKKTLHRMSYIENRIEHLQTNFGKILESLKNTEPRQPTDTLKSIKKRAVPLGFIGTASKFLFGTLSEEDGEKYDQQIRHLTAKQIELAKIAKDDAHLVHNRLNNIELRMRKERHDISEALKVLNETAKDLYYLRLDWYRWSYVTDLNYVLNEVESLLNLFADTLEDVLSIITYSKMDLVHPELVTPDQLMKIIRQIEDHHQNVEFPLPIDISRIEKLTHLAEISLGYKARKVVIKITVPLLEKEPTYLYKMHPIPIPQDLTTTKISASIKPKSKYIAVNDHLKSYSFLNEDDLLNCKQFRHRKICPRKHRMIEAAAKSDCEYMLLHQPSLVNLTECDIMVTHEKRDTWVYLDTVDGWLYSLKQNYSILIKCEKEMQYVNIQGLGILQLRPKCEAKYKHITLYSQQGIGQSIQFLYLPNIALNVSKLDPKIPNKINHVIAPLSEDLLTEDLEMSFNEIQRRYDQAIMESQSDSLHHYTTYSTIIGIWVLGIGCAVATYIIYNLTQQYRHEIFQLKKRTNDQVQDNAEGDQEHRSHPPIPERKNVGTRAFDQHQDEEEAS